MTQNSFGIVTCPPERRIAYGDSSHSDFTARRKWLYLLRLVPLVEKNFNLGELGPRGTGSTSLPPSAAEHYHNASGAYRRSNISQRNSGDDSTEETTALAETALSRIEELRGILHRLEGKIDALALSLNSPWISSRIIGPE